MLQTILSFYFSPFITILHYLNSTPLALTVHITWGYIALASLLAGVSIDWIALVLFQMMIRFYRRAQLSEYMLQDRATRSSTTKLTSIYPDQLRRSTTH